MIIKETYNFKKINNSFLYSYYDEKNVVALRIIKSGWENKFDCILEWGEYEQVEVHLYTAEQINKIYGIKTFLRKEKLDKLNESTL